MIFVIHRSTFDSFTIPEDLDEDYPTIKIINNNVDILLQGMTIQAIVIESPLKIKEISEQIAIKKEAANKKNIETPNLPEPLLNEVNRLKFFQLHTIYYYYDTNILLLIIVLLMNL